ncbi:hypothetical protein ZWY2020_037072 [Hordeum vulgare]|nr:hypothetical protein ZWY2020_037072 [Hordeum vulgare]
MRQHQCQHRRQRERRSLLSRGTTTKTTHLLLTDEITYHSTLEEKGRSSWNQGLSMRSEDKRWSNNQRKLWHCKATTYIHC